MCLVLWAPAAGQGLLLPDSFQAHNCTPERDTGMARVGWSQALLDCPRGARVALCRAQKTLCAGDWEGLGLAVLHPDAGGVLSTSLPQQHSGEQSFPMRQKRLRHLG